jgi:hypothetical protein
MMNCKKNRTKLLYIRWGISHALHTDLRRRYISITIIVLDNASRLVFYLKHTMDNVRTSQETRFLCSRTKQGYAIYRSVMIVY